MDTAAIDPETWREQFAQYQRRVDELTRGRQDRQASGRRDEVEDFLFTYYPVRIGKLRQWHPGFGVTLRGTRSALAPWLTARWYRCEHIKSDEFYVHVDGQQFMADRRTDVNRIHRLLCAISGREGHFGCFGMHEWAMVYRQEEHRHTLPLRLSQQRTDEIVESAQIRCSHFDAFRFFTAQARPLNLLTPTATSREDLEQPACLHANMDLLRHAIKLIPVLPGELVLDCFELARDIRILDMEASPYDVTARGYGTVAIETKQGRVEYIERQRDFARRAAVLRDRILTVTGELVAIGAHTSYA